MTKERALFIGGCWDGRLCDVEPEQRVWCEALVFKPPLLRPPTLPRGLADSGAAMTKRSRYRRSVLMCESGRKEFKPTVFYIEESLSDFDAMTLLVTWYSPDKKDVS